MTPIASSEPPLIVDALEPLVFAALGLLQSARVQHSPLAFLHIYQQLSAGKDEASKDPNRALLDEAWQALAASAPDEAQLLRRRFWEKRLMKEAARDMTFTPLKAQRTQKRAIRQLATILIEREETARQAVRSAQIQRLEHAQVDIPLVGVEAHLQTLLSWLQPTTARSVVVVTGIGGIGKTVLTSMLVRRLIETSNLTAVAWVTAQPHFLTPGGVILPSRQATLSQATLFEALYNQLLSDLPRPVDFSAEGVFGLLRQRLQQGRYLVVIDNLETLEDLEHLLPLVMRLANPSQFVLTSRQKLKEQPGLAHFSVSELSLADAILLVRQEAARSESLALQLATDEQLLPIYDKVGGNPLALRLIAGQLHYYALADVLENLDFAHGAPVENLYRFIYQHSWNLLDEPARQLFLATPLLPPQGASLGALLAIVGLPRPILVKALDQLLHLNLINISAGLTERLYSIHSLTRTFLHEGPAQWQRANHVSQPA